MMEPRIMLFAVIRDQYDSIFGFYKAYSVLWMA